MLPRPDQAAILASLPPLPDPLYWGVQVNHVYLNRWEVSIKMHCLQVDVVGVFDGAEPEEATVEELVASAIQQAWEVGAPIAKAPADGTP